MNVNEIEFINYITCKYQIEKPQPDFDKVFASTYQREVEGKYWPRTHFTYDNKCYPVDVVVYHIPFSGMSEFLNIYLILE